MKVQIKRPSICLASIADSNLPILSFISGKANLNLILDSGSCTSVIFNPLPDNPLVKRTDKVQSIHSIAGKVEENPIVELYLEYFGQPCPTEMVVIPKEAEVDTKGILKTEIHGILGTDFMRRYGFVIDFTKDIAYSTILKNE